MAGCGIPNCYTDFIIKPATGEIWIIETKRR
jgi:hypothetical protein